MVSVRIPLAIALFLSAAGSWSAGNVISDDFGGTSLGSQWTVLNANPSSSVGVNGSGQVVLTASYANGGSDLWGGTNYNAPRILQAVNSADDWLVVTKVDFAPTNNYQGAGIIVQYTSATDIDRPSERAYYPNGGGSVIRSVGPYVPYSAGTSYLALQKQGTTYTGWVSGDGINWQLNGRGTNTGPASAVGLFAIRQPWDGAGLNSVASFDYFHAIGAGDVNFDGKVNGDDYTIIDRSFDKHVTGAHWTDGDFTGDGVVDSTDYLIIDTAYGKATGQLPESLLSQRESQFGAGYVAALTAAVPEPGTALLGIVSLALLGGRDRRSGHHRSSDPH